VGIAPQLEIVRCLGGQVKEGQQPQK
jgi:hypothetical protein